MTTPTLREAAQSPEDTADMVGKSLRRAWQLGQKYWQQADSESYADNKRANETAVMFAELVNNTIAALAQPVPDAVPQPLTDAQMNSAINGAGPDLLALAQQWADNKIHTHQFSHEANCIVARAIEHAHGIVPAPTTGEGQ
jgi:hypothetical protein